MAKKMSNLDWAAWVLLLVGGVNWGLVGLLQLDLVALALGTVPVAQQVVYVLIGLSAVYIGYKKFS